MGEGRIPVRLRYVFAWLVLAAVLLLADLELRRIAAGNLFLLSIAGEAPPSRVELVDARRTAAACTWPARIAILAIGSLVILTLHRKPAEPSLRPIGPWLLALFAFSAVGDLVSTVAFFHQEGIDHEVHPAIRLFGYAYGRTAGPILGKSLQVGGVILLSAYLPKYGRWIVMAATVLYLLAAIHNLSQT